MAGHYSNASERFEAAASPAAAPKVSAHSTICDTPEAIERYRMCTLLSALSLEAKGIRIRRGFSALKVVCTEFDIKAKTAADAYTKLRAVMVAKGIIEAAPDVK